MVSRWRKKQSKQNSARKRFGRAPETLSWTWSRIAIGRSVFRTSSSLVVTLKSSSPAHGVSPSCSKKARKDIPPPSHYDRGQARKMKRDLSTSWRLRMAASNGSLEQVSSPGLTGRSSNRAKGSWPRDAPLSRGMTRIRSRCLLGLGRWRQLVRSAGSGGTEEQFASVREGKIPTVGAVRAIFRLIAVDHDLGAGQPNFLAAAPYP
jgi:hypothetical protein